MSLKSQLQRIWDTFSVRREANYKPAEISGRLRARILMLYVDVIAGRMTTNPYSSCSQRLFLRVLGSDASVVEASIWPTRFVQHPNSFRC